MARRAEKGENVRNFQLLKRTRTNSYNAVSNSDMMKMSYKLTYRTLRGKTKKIIERKETRHWWLNGFKVGHAWSIYRLHLNASIEFENANMVKLFCKNLSKSARTSRKNKKVRIKW